MNSLNYVCFDLETGGLSAEKNDAISVAAVAYDGRTLEPIPPAEGGEFDSLMKPLDFSRLQDQALAVNKITREELAKAPDQKLVWNEFVKWVGRFNKKGTAFGAPIAVGKNIRAFDMAFVRKLNGQHCKKKEKTVLFHKRLYDLEDVLFLWFENSDELPDLKMDTLREFMGLSKVGAHSALVDSRQTGAVFMRFLKLKRELRSRKTGDGKEFIRFRGCFQGSSL